MISRNSIISFFKMCSTFGLLAGSIVVSAKPKCWEFITSSSIRCSWSSFN